MLNYIFTVCDNLDLLNHEEYFKDYDFVEEYDKNYSYEKKISREYDGQLREYENQLFSIGERNSNKVLNYVVSKEILSNEELEKLKPHCQCSFHEKYWFNPIKYYICRCCVGCLDAGEHYYSMQVVKKTRKYIQENY